MKTYADPKHWFFINDYRYRYRVPYLYTCILYIFEQQQNLAYFVIAFFRWGAYKAHRMQPEDF